MAVVGDRDGIDSIQPSAIDRDADCIRLSVEGVPDQLRCAGDRPRRPGQSIELVSINLDDESLWHRTSLCQEPTELSGGTQGRLCTDTRLDTNGHNSRLWPRAELWR